MLPPTAHWSRTSRLAPPKVVDVSLPPGLNLETAVRRADPTGREAMAAEYYSSQW